MPALPRLSFGAPGTGRFYSVKREEKRNAELDELKNRLKFYDQLRKDLTFAAHLWRNHKFLIIMIQLTGVSKGVFCASFCTNNQKINNKMSENVVYLDGKTLTPETLVSLQKFDSQIDLTEAAWDAVKKSREVKRHKISNFLKLNLGKTKGISSTLSLKFSNLGL